MMISTLKALSGCSSHHLQGAAGTYCGGPTIGRKDCLQVKRTLKRSRGITFIRLMVSCSCCIWCADDNASSWTSVRRISFSCSSSCRASTASSVLPPAASLHNKHNCQWRVFIATQKKTGGAMLRNPYSPLASDNNNNNNHDDIYSAVIMSRSLREFTRFIWWM